MASNMPNNALIPQTPDNRLMRPTMADALRAGPPPEPPSLESQIPPVAPGSEISSRVPVPPDHFPEDEHDGLHEMMGEAFDNPVAQHFVRVGYQAAKGRHPNVHAKHLLHAARDAYHAVQYGFSPVEHALDYIGQHARARHLEEQARKANGGNP